MSLIVIEFRICIIYQIRDHEENFEHPRTFPSPVTGLLLENYSLHPLKVQDFSSALLWTPRLHIIYHYRDKQGVREVKIRTRLYVRHTIEARISPPALMYDRSDLEGASKLHTKQNFNKSRSRRQLWLIRKFVPTVVCRVGAYLG